MKLRSGQVAVVTGGASGIGLALAEAFAERGLSVVLADIEQPALDDATRQLADQGATVLGVRTDVSAAGQVEDLAGTVLDRFRRVDVVVNNAGVMLKARTPFQDIGYEDWRWLVDVNLWGVVHGLRAFVPLLAEQGHGHLVNVASEAGIVPAVSGVAPYAMTSHAVVGLSETLAADLAEQAPGVGVTVLCPGLVAGTRLIDSARNRPGGRGPAMDPGEPPPGLVMLDPRAVADETLAAIEDDRLHLAVGEGIAHGVRTRVDRLLADVNAPSHAGAEQKAAPTMTIDEIARTIHEAHLKGMPALLDVLQSLAADQVTITYHPARPFVEGTMSATDWIAFERGMVAKADERGMRVETSDQRVAVDGDDIVLEEVMMSTDLDGKSFRVPFRGVFHVRDGKVTGYDAYVDPGTTPAFLEQDEKAVREAL